MHGRIYVAEVPFIGRNLSVGMGIQVAQHQQKLLFSEVEVHQRKRKRVEGQVPRRIPGILPFVGHGDDVAVEHVEPVGVAGGFRCLIPPADERHVRSASDRGRNSNTAWSTAFPRVPAGERDAHLRVRFLRQ